MRKNALNILCILAAYTLLLTSCGYSYYYPQSGRMPLVSQQGELVVDANIPFAAMNLESAIVYSPKDMLFAYDASLAYAFTDHFAAQMSSRKTIDTRHEAMLGWYSPLGSHATVELYGGYAYALCSARDETYCWSKKGTAQTIFMQADIGFPSYTSSLLSCSFTAGFGIRVGGVSYDYTTTNYTVIHNGSETVAEITDITPVQMLKGEIQPLVKLAWGWERLKFEVSAGWSWMDTPNWSDHCPWGFNCALSYRIPLKRNAK